MASDKSCSGKPHWHAGRWRRYGQRKRFGRARAAAVEGSHRHRVRPRRMRIGHAHHACDRIAFQCPFEIGGGGDVDPLRVHRGGIGRIRCVCAQCK